MSQDQSFLVVQSDALSCLQSMVRRVLASMLMLMVGAWGPLADAVELSANEKGEALILPIFSTHDGLQTLLTVTNTKTADRSLPRVAKITFRDRDGRFLLSVNAYINSAGAWVASMTSSGSGATIQFPGPICTLGQGSGGAVATTSASIESKIGFIEVLELGAIDGLAGAAEADQGNCQELANVWNEEEWSQDENTDMVAPANALRASSSIIDVDQGTMYSFTGAALVEFSDIHSTHVSWFQAPKSFLRT